MKQIVTVVRPHLAESLLAGLKRAPVEAISVAEVKGFGRQKSYLDQYEESEYSEAFLADKAAVVIGLGLFYLA